MRLMLKGQLNMTVAAMASLLLRTGLCVALGLGSAGAAAADAHMPVTTTIVLIRHAEKPDLGLGQLNCQGLNRALALPAVLGRLFGKPDTLIAPDPAEPKEDHGHQYAYVRPLATIEPTAISFGLPVDTSIGVTNLVSLRKKLESLTDRPGVVVVAWEHVDVAKLARLLVADYGGDPAIVPDWQWDDFDSIYVLRLTKSNAANAVAFDLRHQGLDGMPTTCPGPASR